jgi:hypothetical protein
MNDRVRVRVQNEQGHWRTAYVLWSKLAENLSLLKAYGFKVRVG